MKILILLGTSSQALGLVFTQSLSLLLRDDTAQSNCTGTVGKFKLVKHKSKTDKSVVLLLQHNFKCSVKTSFASDNFIFFSDKIDFA